MTSVEGKSNKACVQFIDNTIVWKGISIPVILIKQNTSAHLALRDKVKYVRIKRELVKGSYTYYAKLVVAGSPAHAYNSEGLKQQLIIGSVGIYSSTSTVVDCAEKKVILDLLAPNVVNYESETK